MTCENHFNLVDEPWLPVADQGRVSLRQLFSQPEYRSLGGNPVQKIALTKLLLAIAQAACTPETETQWQQLGWQGMAEQCLAYLDTWHGCFYLYGEQPFLQMPAISVAQLQSYGAVVPEVSTGNTTVLTQSQQEQPLADSDKAVLLVSLMAFALAGKKTDNSVVLEAGYQGKSNARGKPSSGKTGPAMAHMGLLHSFVLGENLLQTLWLNLLSQDAIDQAGLYPGGVGIAPWQQMPATEGCTVALALKESLMGRLVPVCRFCLLQEAGLHYSEGLAHDSHNEGRYDPTIAINTRLKKPKVLWANPERRPWRELTGLLSFVQQQNGDYDCLQLRLTLPRAMQHTDRFAVWSGGLQVSANAGEQYASGNNDSVESQAWLCSDDVQQALWFSHLQAEMAALEQLAKTLYGCVIAYFRQLKVEKSSHPAQASNLFWQLCERQFQPLLDSCDNSPQGLAERQQLRQQFSQYLQQTYNQFCPNHSARQLDAWASCRPDLARYLTPEVK